MYARFCSTWLIKPLWVNRMACSQAEQKARASEEPWALITGREMPSRGAPPML